MVVWNDKVAEILTIIRTAFNNKNIVRKNYRYKIDEHEISLNNFIIRIGYC